MYVRINATQRGEKPVVTFGCHRILNELNVLLEGHPFRRRMETREDWWAEPTLQGPEEGEEVLFFGGGELELEDEVEELDGVVEG
jgi:hypothetical protein